MNTVLKRSFTKRWLQILKEYELIKKKNSKKFKQVKDLCECYQISRKDMMKYYERWILSGKDEQALLPRKSGPKVGQMKMLSKEEERIIMKIRRRFETSGPILREMIKDKFDIPPSVSTIYRTFKKYPLNAKRKKEIKRYEKAYPGELVHGDAYYIDPTMLADKRKYKLVGYIDDCTRLCYVEIVDKLTAHDTSMVFGRAYKWFMLHGFELDRILTDNGAEFTAHAAKTKEVLMKHAFETVLAMHEVKHSRTMPYRPQSNGKIERFWRILQDECLRKQLKTVTRVDLKEEIKQFMFYYNYKRRHGSLEYKTPLEKLKKIADLLPEL
jgi:transposase InsO family protein